ncbi:DNA-binding HxlR family transcriptional regulator [Chitinophaga dinghuensis]|uniref:DNA-binding HxlR family transcriptional regulator n=1 Tax=Chitinophaga dinghuensis TaxID=1539050 RepID=A0A327VNN5_9BACT|nr:helix-turn-helix domain-containing protein [Chitinophaga dinghuensis]RAJ75089.1 DNA-binding HxlR family transcriptional regulator [Chitinophaga dinghuensis]
MGKTKKNSTNNINKEKIMAQCTETYAMNMIGTRWKLAVFYHLKKGPLRFSNLKELIGEVSDRMLTLHLREMEEDGLVIRTVYPEVPVRVEYHLTESAMELQPVWDFLRAWGRRHRNLMTGVEPTPLDLNIAYKGPIAS